MPQRLKLSEQRTLLKAIPLTLKKRLKKHCNDCEMKGKGLKDILKSAREKLGYLAKELGPTVFKEFIIPFLKEKYMSGTGLRLAGQRKLKK